MNRASVAALAALTLVVGLAGAAPLAHAADASVVSSAYRFDFGPVLAGAHRSGNFTLTNPSDAPIVVSLTHEGDPPFFVHTVGRVAIAARGNATVDFAYDVAADSPPGNHGELLQLRPQVANATGGGSVVGVTSIVFTSRTTGIGVEAIEAPASILPGGALAGRVLVVSTWNESANATLSLTVVDAGGLPIAPPLALGSAPIRPGNATAFPFEFRNASFPRGNLSLVARVESVEPANAPLAGATFTKPLTVGAREVSLFLDAFQDRRDGSSLATLRLVSTSTVAVTVTPHLRFTSRTNSSAAPFDLALAPVALAPGASTSVDATVRLPPGDYTLTADATANDGSPLIVHGATRTVTLAPPAIAAPPLDLGPWLRAAGIVLIVALVALAVLGVYRLARRRVRAPHAVPSEKGVPPAEPNRRRVALLVDLASLAPHFPDGAPDLARFVESAASAGAIVRRVAYVAVRDKTEATRALDALADSGFEGVIRVGGQARAALRLRIALDAIESVEEGARVVALASRDASLAELARGIARAGGRFEVVGSAEGIPLALLEAADAVRPIPSAKGAGALPSVEPAAPDEDLAEG